MTNLNVNNNENFERILIDISVETAIPIDELKKLLAIPYKDETDLPRPLALKNMGFSRTVIDEIRDELNDKLTVKRRDIQANIHRAFIIIFCNLICSVFSRKKIAIPGDHQAYNRGGYFNKIRLSRRAVKTVINALEGKYIKKTAGSVKLRRTDSYEPTGELEIKLIPLIYKVKEEYTDTTELIVLNRRIEDIQTEEHIMQRRSSIILETTHGSDLRNLKRINDALKYATYALKGPVRRIYSDGSPMKGGRLYVRLQSLPDKRARIRINTLFNGKPVAEVDLSANHPSMLMALEKQKLPHNFYDLIAENSGTTRDQVKFLVMKMIGAKNRSISLVLDVNDKDWFRSVFVMTQEDRVRIEGSIANLFPALSNCFYKGMGVYLQAFEGDILITAMLKLLDQGILSLPIHDAIYVQREYVEVAQRALEDAWMAELGVEFKPFTKVDMGD